METFTKKIKNEAPNTEVTKMRHFCFSEPSHKIIYICTHTADELDQSSAEVINVCEEREECSTADHEIVEPEN